jgi:hypothetical protein
MVESIELENSEEPTTVDGAQTKEVAHAEAVLEEEAIIADDDAGDASDVDHAEAVLEEEDIVTDDNAGAASDVDTEAEVAVSAEGEEAPGDAEEEGEVEEEPERPEGVAWFVVHSYSGYENKVKKNLEHRIESMGMLDQIFQVVVPTEEEVELRDGQRRTTERRVFPGYILVEMLMNDDTWYVVRNTPGVTDFVRSGAKPIPLRQE